VSEKAYSFQNVLDRFTSEVPAAAGVREQWPSPLAIGKRDRFDAIASVTNGIVEQFFDLGLLSVRGVCGQCTANERAAGCRRGDDRSRNDR